MNKQSVLDCDHHLVEERPRVFVTLCDAGCHFKPDSDWSHTEPLSLKPTLDKLFHLKENKEEKEETKKCSPLFVFHNDFFQKL